MGEYLPKRFYVLFAFWTVVVVVVLVAVFLTFRLQAITNRAEQDAAMAAASVTTAALAAEANGTAEPDPDAFTAAATGLVGETIKTVRLWSDDGSLLAATDGATDAVVEPGDLSAALEGAIPASKVGAASGDLLVSYARAGPGAVIEIQQSYDPIAASIATSQRLLIFSTVGGAVLLVLVVQGILWITTDGLKRDYSRLLQLYKSGQAIRASLDLTEVLEQLAHDVALYTQSQLVIISLVEEGGNELVVKVSYDRDVGTTAQHHRKVAEWFVLRCAATGEPLVANEQFPYTSMLGYDRQAPEPEFILSAAIPGRERPIGVITVVRTAARGEFRPADLRIITDMASQGALVVEQALLFAKMRRYGEEVELGYDSTLKVLMAALDTKDSITQGHSERVARLTVALGRELDMPNERLIDLERGALLHDIGKIGVPDEILRKPASLDPLEWEAMQKHPLLAGLMVSKVEFLEGALPILLYHHERYDGGGYPFGLKGEAIPLEARIFAVIDTYDAMTSDRPYRKALTHEIALREIQRQSGTQFDPDVVDAFLRLMARRVKTAGHAA